MNAYSAADNAYLDEMALAIDARPRPNGGPFIKRFKRADDFVREYEPISYTIEGVLPSAAIYGVTGRKGTGKTAWLTTVALAVITGREDLIGLAVQKGRVAYVTLENPADFRMKLSVNRYVLNIPMDAFGDNLVIIDARLKPEEIMAQLAVSTEEDGRFQLVIYDTFQAGFEGAEFNSNTDVLAFTRRLRAFTTLPGSPSVLLAMHPTKSAGEEDLVPYGGGATMNELDGNLTLWSENGQIKLHWNKVRGPEFEPRYFRIEKLSSPDIVDIQGRQILLPICRAVSEQAAEQRERDEVDIKRALLIAMDSQPGASQSEWAATVGRTKSIVNKHLQALKAEGLVESVLGGKWRVTPKGKKAL
jgi:hypothetical protein